MWNTTQILPYSDELVERARIDPLQTFIGLQDAGVVRGFRENMGVKMLRNYELVQSATGPVLLVHYIESGP